LAKRFRAPGVVRALRSVVSSSLVNASTVSRVLTITVILLAISQPAWAVGICDLSPLYCYEAENFSTKNGVRTVNTTTQGNSGTGYVTDFFDAGDSIATTVNAPAGLYELWVGYRVPSSFGDKGYRFRVGNEYGTGTLEESGTFKADRAGLFNLAGGSTTLGIEKDWGWHDIDYLQFKPFTPPAILPVSAQLTDAAANQNTRMLMNYLTGIYGQYTLAGHQHDESKNLAFPSSTYLNLSGGLKPAIRSSDFMEYSPSRLAFGANPNNESEQSIAWAKHNNGIISMNWHWNAPANLVNSSQWPWWSGFYTQATTFNLAGALANPSGSDYQLLLRDIDAVSRQLLKFQDAGVPVIWRPLHEAQGNANGTSGNGAWFWWGAAGPDAFKQLWRLMYNRLTTPRTDASFQGGVFPGLHNLIWEFTSSAAKTGYLNWYPGDDVVDMIGLDIYTDPSSSMSGEWYDVLAQYNGRKMIALSESGTLPNADLMRAYGISWDYFSLWKDDFLDDFPASKVQALLNDNKIITLNELPTLPWSNSAPVAGDFNRNGTVDMGDYILWRKSQGQAGWGLAADSDLNGRIDGADYAAWRSHFGQPSGSGAFNGGAVPEPASWILLIAAAWPIFVRRRAIRA
jgi:mannan endo-1,4-beta-mannosidase